MIAGLVEEEDELQGLQVLQDSHLEQGVVENDMMVIQQEGMEQEDVVTEDNTQQLNVCNYMITTNGEGQTIILGPDGRQYSTQTTEDGQMVFSVPDGEDGQQMLMLDNPEVDPADQIIMPTEEAVSTPAVEVEPQAPSRFPNLFEVCINCNDPISKLRTLIAAKISEPLDDSDVYLQLQSKLDASKSLRQTCVEGGQGNVQVNLRIVENSDLSDKPILSVEDVLGMESDNEANLLALQEQQLNQYRALTQAQNKAARQPKVVIPFQEDQENVTRWVVDQAYKSEQDRLGIPQDPYQWNEDHVQHWIRWAIEQFKLQYVDADTFGNMTGKEVCAMQHEDFQRLVVEDRRDAFWTHLELLRKCRFVATVHQPTPHAITTITVSSSDPLAQGSSSSSASRVQRPLGGKSRSVFLGSERISPGNRTGNNGQIQLWQFLLEMLTEKNNQDYIHWVGDDGEFKLAQPEIVAKMWGDRKNKTSMNYEKLSRALRYYYDGDMIAKVPGKRFCYKYVCDLKAVIGYTAAELSREVKNQPMPSNYETSEHLTSGRRLTQPRQRQHLGGPQRKNNQLIMPSYSRNSRQEVEDSIAHLKASQENRD